jgi:hypothetical protein
MEHEREGSGKKRARNCANAAVGLAVTARLCLRKFCSHGLSLHRGRPTSGLLRGRPFLHASLSASRASWRPSCASSFSLRRGRRPCGRCALLWPSALPWPWSYVSSSLQSLACETTPLRIGHPESFVRPKRKEYEWVALTKQYRGAGRESRMRSRIQESPCFIGFPALIRTRITSPAPSRGHSQRLENVRITLLRGFRVASAEGHLRPADWPSRPSVSSPDRRTNPQDWASLSPLRPCPDLRR